MIKNSDTPKTVFNWQAISCFTLILALLALFFFYPGGVSGKKSLRVGLVFDTAGPGDLGFNDLSYQGLLLAESKLGVIGRTYTPASFGDIEAQIRQCVADHNALCLTVGFLTTDAAILVASEIPQVAFAIIDRDLDDGLENLRSIKFNRKQSGYLAGIVAGRMTGTDKLGVVAGMEIPPVIDYAEGFRNAVQCSNSSADVRIEYTGSFNEPEVGAAAAEIMVLGGADVIFNVAGGTGNGAILRGAELGAWVVGVDVDQYWQLFDGLPTADRILTSAMLNLDVGVYGTIEDFTKGGFTPGIKMYDLNNNGIGLAPFHEASGYIPTGVVKQLDKTRKDITKGKLDIDAPCR